jgi:hypothetical protein
MKNGKIVTRSVPRSCWYFKYDHPLTVTMKFTIFGLSVFKAFESNYIKRTCSNKSGNYSCCIKAAKKSWNSGINMTHEKSFTKTWQHSTHVADAIFLLHIKSHASHVKLIVNIIICYKNSLVRTEEKCIGDTDRLNFWDMKSHFWALHFVNSLTNSIWRFTYIANYSALPPCTFVNITLKITNH